MPRRTPNLDDDHVQFLQQSVKDATSALDRLKKEIRKETESVQRQKKGGKPWVLTGFLLRIVLILYYLAGYQTFLAVPYLHRAGRKKDGRTLQMSSWQNSLRELLWKLRMRFS